MLYAQVAINIPVRNLLQFFTYSVPEKFTFLSTGWRVLVPFGANLLEGFVMELTEEADPTLSYKAIADVLGTEAWFDEEMLTTARWLARYYLCSLAEALRLFIPGKRSVKTKARYLVAPIDSAKLSSAERTLYAYIQQKGGLYRQEIEKLSEGAEALRGLVRKKAVRQEFEIRPKLSAKLITLYSLTEAGKQELTGDVVPKMAKQRSALKLIEQLGAVELRQITEQGVSASTVRTLLKKGYLQKEEKRLFRDSYNLVTAKGEGNTLTSEQELAVSTVSADIQAQHHRTYLLQGITGSGKTEVYLRLAQQACAKGKQVVVLVPEIALTGQIVRRFKAYFGTRVVVAHSKLTPSERGDVWEKMRYQKADILIGVRSAIFVPLHNPGLIIIDEEHEYTYKQEERPYYNAKTVALYRATHYHIPVVLGSATPSLESYYYAKQGLYGHLRLTKRPVAGSELPEISVVDMRQELARGNRSVLSEALRSALLTTTERGEQAVVLLNRRGYSTFVLCRECGETISCPNCAVSLVYHRKEQHLTCHYCGYTAPIPQACPHCHSSKIKYFGTGTERAEEEIASLGATLRVARMDQDSTAQKFAHEQILNSFVSGESNVLLGTQMVAKGHDIPNVTCVGILSADSQLNVPDFRSGERTFALLTQAAGRAGRGSKRGAVLIQAYEADSPILHHALSQDYDSFAAEELSVRQELNYPPFCRLLKIIVLAKEKEQGEAKAEEIANYLTEHLASTSEVLGPIPALVPKVMNIYRTHIIVKSTALSQVKEVLRQAEFFSLPNIYFDVDPIASI